MACPVARIERRGRLQLEAQGRLRCGRGCERLVTILFPAEHAFFHIFTVAIDAQRRLTDGMSFSEPAALESGSQKVTFRSL